MEQCEYWWINGTEEHCDLTCKPCKCGGDNAVCCLKGKTITDVIRQEENVTLREASARAHRRRIREAS